MPKLNSVLFLAILATGHCFVSSLLSPPLQGVLSLLGSRGRIPPAGLTSSLPNPSSSVAPESSRNGFGILRPIQHQPAPNIQRQVNIFARPQQIPSSNGVVIHPLFIQQRGERNRDDSDEDEIQDLNGILLNGGVPGRPPVSFRDIPGGASDYMIITSRPVASHVRYRQLGFGAIPQNAARYALQSNSHEPSLGEPILPVDQF